jgi:hypothetical protein
MLVKLFTWTGTIIFFVILAVYSKRFDKAEPPARGIYALETASRNEGKAILLSWQQDEASLAAVAKRITIYDFFFLVFYVSLLIMLSNNQMYRETWLPLNSLLRFSIPLAIITGLLDVTENILLLYNLRDWQPDQPYVQSFWITLPKFIFAGWIILVWLVSAIKGLVKK